MNSNWNLVGHEWAVDMLKKHVIHGTMRHAYLFAGPPGLGRRTLALRFAQALNCQTPIEPGIPCGECRDCKQIASMQHADLTVIQGQSQLAKSLAKTRLQLGAHPAAASGCGLPSPANPRNFVF